MATLQQAIDNLVAATATANDVINQAKAVNTATTAHKADPNAHKELFAKPAPDVDLGGGNTAKGQGQIGRCVRTATVTDANQYVTDGRYFIFNIDAVSNWPVEGSGGVLRVDSYSTYILQEMQLLGGRVYRRTKWAAGEWLPWKLAMMNDLANKAGGYVSVSKDGMAVLGNQEITPLNISGTSATMTIRDRGRTPIVAIIRDCADALAPMLLLGKNRGDSAKTFAPLQQSDYLGRIAFMGSNDSGFSEPASEIRCCAEADAANSITPVALRFSTSGPSDATSVSRWDIRSDGTFRPCAPNAYDIGVSGMVVRNIYSANAVTVGSDRRLKTAIEDTPLGLDFIKALRPVAYRLIIGDQTVTMERETDENGEPLFVDVQDGTEQVRTGTDENGEPIMEERPIMRREPKLREVVATRPGVRTHYGLIAQEVRETLDSVAPGVDFAGWVLEDKNDPDSQQALRYEQFIAPLIRAVQEQQAQLEALKAEVAELKAGV